jgi:hypothetical protein
MLPAISMFISGSQHWAKESLPCRSSREPTCYGLGRRGHENPAGKHLRAILLRLLWPRMKRLRYPRPRLYRAVHVRPPLPIQYSRIQIRVSEYRSAGLTPLIRGGVQDWVFGGFPKPSSLQAAMMMTRRRRNYKHAAGHRDTYFKKRIRQSRNSTYCTISRNLLKMTSRFARGSNY